MVLFDQRDRDAAQRGGRVCPQPGAAELITGQCRAGEVVFRRVADLEPNGRDDLPQIDESRGRQRR